MAKLQNNTILVVVLTSVLTAVCSFFAQQALLNQQKLHDYNQFIIGHRVELMERLADLTAATSSEQQNGDFFSVLTQSSLFFGKETNQATNDILNFRTTSQVEFWKIEKQKYADLLNVMRNEIFARLEGVPLKLE